VHRTTQRRKREEDREGHHPRPAPGGTVPADPDDHRHESTPHVDIDAGEPRPRRSFGIPLHSLAHRIPR